MKGEPSKEKTEFSIERGNGRGGYHGRGRGRGGRFGGKGRGRGSEHKNFNQKTSFRCHHCKKFGHKEANCWSKQSGEPKKANFVGTDTTKETLFMAHLPDAAVKHDIWFNYSGCSNHMCNSQPLFGELDVNHKSEVRLGDNNKAEVEGKGTITIVTSSGTKKVLHDVFFVPNLAHNLLSVGQLVKNGSVVLFDDSWCVIRDKKSGQNVANVDMTLNKMFLLDFSTVNNRTLVTKECNESDLWHLRYGHLHLNGLKLLKKKDMVLHLPNIESIKFCEICVMGKHSKKSFSVGNS